MIGLGCDLPAMGGDGSRYGVFDNWFVRFGVVFLQWG